jgi:hypothetical protein
MSEKHPYDLQTEVGERFFVVEDHAHVVLMETGSVVNDDIWYCYPVVHACPCFGPTKARAGATCSPTVKCRPK